MLRIKRIFSFQQQQQQQQQQQKRNAYAYVFPGSGANEYDEEVGVLRSVLAGMGSSVATILCSHPFDVVRSRRQAKPKQAGLVQRHARKRDALRAIYVDDLREMVSLVHEEGPLALYKSVGVHLFGHIVSGVIYYSVEAFFKEHLYHRLPPTSNFFCRMGRRMLISTMAGFVQVSATHPLWVLKNREQLAAAATTTATTTINAVAGENNKSGKQQQQHHHHQQQLQQHRAPIVRIFGDLYSLWKNEGVAGLYAGIVPSLVLTAHTSLQYALYDELKMGIARIKGAPLSGLDRSLAGIASKTLALSVSNPVLMVRTRLMEKGSTYTGVADVVKKVWHEEGPMAFYKGSSVGLYKILAAGISHPVYDAIAYRTKSFFGK